MPHSFLSVTNPDGSTTEYGLVPAVEGSPFNKGKIDITGSNTPHGAHEKSFIGEPIQLTNEQYSRLMNSINNAIANPPDYNVFGSSFSETGNNCTGWAVSV